MQQHRMSWKITLFILVVLAFSLSGLAFSTQAATHNALSYQAHSRAFTALTAGSVTEYLIPTNKSQPVGITSGPDGNLWFTEGHGNTIGKLTTSGVFSEFALPTAGSQPEGITSGPCGDGTHAQCLWFTEFNSLFGNRIGKITLSGTISEYALPNADSEPESITTGPDGNLWFTEFDGNRIGMITPSGQVTEYSLPMANSEPEGITSGPCGDGMQAQCLWFTEFAFNATNQTNIGRISTSGTITEFPLLTQFARANDITLGPGGILYFTEEINNGSDTTPSTQAKIGQITTTGSAQISELPSLPNGGCLPNGITTGSDGNLWFTEYYQIGSITPAGTITEYPLPPQSSSFLPDHIIGGSDGNLWFTEYTGNNIGKITTH